MRAAEVNYNAYEQVKGRIKAFEIMNHPTDKIELIIMGGTFLQYPKRFQFNFITFAVRVQCVPFNTIILA